MSDTIENNRSRRTAYLRQRADESIEERIFAAAGEIVGSSPPATPRGTRRAVRRIERRIRDMSRRHTFASPFSWRLSSYAFAQGALMAAVASRECPGGGPLSDNDLIAAAVACGMRRRKHNILTEFTVEHFRAISAAANRARAALPQASAVC